jgi:hypothetical protein
MAEKGHWRVLEIVIVLPWMQWAILLNVQELSWTFSVEELKSAQPGVRQMSFGLTLPDLNSSGERSNDWLCYDETVKPWPYS